MPAPREVETNDPNRNPVRVDAGWASTSDYAARMVDAAATLGLSVADFNKMLQTLTQELERLNATATTPAQREYLAHLSRARDVYQDLEHFWQAEDNTPHRDTGSGTRLTELAAKDPQVAAIVQRYRLDAADAAESDPSRLAIQRLKTRAYDEIKTAHAMAY